MQQQCARMLHPRSTHTNTYECTYGGSSLLCDVRRARKFEIRLTPTDGLNVDDNGLCLCAMCAELTCEKCMLIITQGSMRGNVCACSPCVPEDIFPRISIRILQ